MHNNKFNTVYFLEHSTWTPTPLITERTIKIRKRLEKELGDAQYVENFFKKVQGLK